MKKINKCLIYIELVKHKKNSHESFKHIEYRQIFLDIYLYLNIYRIRGPRSKLAGF
jgi:hypothetical protein